MSVEADRYRAFFRFGTLNQAEDVADRLYNRRACSALQGIGGWATNKQSAKSKTFAQLATDKRLRANTKSILKLCKCIELEFIRDYSSFCKICHMAIRDHRTA